MIAQLALTNARLGAAQPSLLPMRRPGLMLAPDLTF